MRLLLPTWTTPCMSRRFHHLKKTYSWIPFVTVLTSSQPISTWAFQSRQSLPCFPYDQSSTFHFPHPSMPRRSTRTSSSTTTTPVVAAATKVDEGGESPSRKRKKVSEDSAETSTPKKKTASAKKIPVKDTTTTTKATATDSPKKGTRGPKGATSISPSAKKTTTATAKKKSTTTTPTKKTVLPEAPDSSSSGGEDETSDPAPTPTKKVVKKKTTTPKHQQITERDILPKLWDDEKRAKSDSYTFRIASWNVAGIRALMRNDPTALSDLCRDHDLDMLCLQETKLQDIHLDDPKLNIRGCVEGYDDYWSCSMTKKGYSGTAVFLKQREGGTKKSKQASISSFFGKKSKKDGEDTTSDTKVASSEIDPALVTPTNVSYTIGKPIDDEGRTITMEFPFATITNVYVPNSGQKLERLDYRTTEWDKDFLAFNQQKEKHRGLPVIWLGDLNIAHKAYDIWNDGAKHLATQAGVTEQERISFQAQLDAGYVDAFRYLHPEAKGHYSYWSQRAGNREPNKGLRLDYFVCSPELFSDDSSTVVRDSYMIPERLGSDHSPVVLELELKSKK